MLKQLAVFANVQVACQNDVEFGKLILIGYGLIELIIIESGIIDLLTTLYLRLNLVILIISFASALALTLSFGSPCKLKHTHDRHPLIQPKLLYIILVEFEQARDALGVGG